MSTFDDTAAAPIALERDRARTVLGGLMGLVAFTLRFVTLGAYVARNLSGGSGLLFFIASRASSSG